MSIFFPNEWPLTKAVMMTAYASTDTAVKAIQLGALDYIPKPFTPEDLRKTVNLALSGELKESTISAAEKETINVIDIDMPFETEEVAKYTGEDYVKTLGRSDMPIVEVKLPEPLEHYCAVGNMVCDIFKKLGATCKIGAKKGFHVDQAVTKAEALEKITTRAYKLFLLDLKIPEVKGLELLKAIRDHHPAAKVIIITGYASIETAVESAGMGITNYLNKPFTPDEIRSATENALRFAA